MATLTGDPESLRTLARWLRTDVAEDLAETAHLIRRIQDSSLDIWNDPPGMAFHLNLGGGIAAIRNLTSKVEALADQLDRTADDLAEAQRLMDRAIQVALDAHLRVEDGWVYAPSRNDVIRQGMPAYDSASVDAIYQRRLSTYRQVVELVERAARLVLDRLGKLKVTLEVDWDSLYFTSADIAAGETALLAGWFERSYLSEAERRLASSRDWLAQSNKFERDSVLEKFFRNEAARQRWAAVGAQTSAASWGWVARVLRGAGPVLFVAGVTYDIVFNHTPIDKAIFVGGVSAGGGLLIAAGVTAAGLGGWPAVIIGAVGAAASGALADYGYDVATQKPARERLFGK
ncbi:MAG TPA: hypothetical protein VIL34_24250 [Actinopolymorphaceae bacterium]|jgi:hypothetical protein